MDRLSFCTLFNKVYLSRGITMIRSLERHENNFTLYVVSFDNETEKILSNMNFNNVVIIKYCDFENEELREAKQNRNSREFFWTCSCHVIEFVLENYPVDHCTYIDADLFFFQTPRILLSEIEKNDGDVGIMSHRYPERQEYKVLEERCGKYCVEFTTFMNTKNGREVLKWWCQQCIEKCVELPDGIHFGDQKYLEEFEEKFKGVYTYEDCGAGVAPWNISEYKLQNNLMYYKNSIPVSIIFYHFHSLHIRKEGRADIAVHSRPGKADKDLVNRIYIPYLQGLRECEKEIRENYGCALEEQEEMLDDGWMAKWHEFISSEINIWTFTKKVGRYLTRKRYDYLNY